MDNVAYLQFSRIFVTFFIFPEGTEEPSEDEEDSTAVREAFMKEQQEKLNREKQRILNDKTIVAEEKTRLLEDIKVETTTIYLIPLH